MASFGTTSDSHEQKESVILGADHVEPEHITEEADDCGFTPAEERNIIRRMDRRLVVTVGVLYCVSLMDRTNMGSTIIAGMGTDLKLINNRYNICNSVFFITYIIFQAPSTVLIRAIGPRIHISTITLLWGGITIAMGFVNTYQQLAGLRVVLGACEAGFYPGVVYLLSTWYTRYEVGKRYAVFWIIGCLASAFSGILAYGLMQLNGEAGLAGWRWIFIIQGIITCALAIGSYWLLVDFPDSSRKTWSFLDARERQWVVKRIERDRADAGIVKFELATFLGAGLDWKIWAYATSFFCAATINYAIAFTLPLILVANLGFSVAAAQCLVAPPFALAAILTFVLNYLGDKLRLRGPFIVFNMVLCLIGLPIIGWHHSAAVRYFGIFLFAAGASSTIPIIMAFQANNIRGQWKRAFCSASLVGFGGIGGIAGSLVFRKQDEVTGYQPGIWACIACCLLTIVLVLLLDFSIHVENRKADQGKKILEADSESSSADFRYTY